MTTSAARRRLWIDATTTAGFVAALVAPSIDPLVRANAERDARHELRQPAELPPFPHGIGGLSSWPKRAENHYDDPFGLRDVLLRAHNAVDLLWLRVPPVEKVLPGEDGWIFYAGDKSMEVWRGTMPFTSDDLAAWTESLRARRDWLAARDIRYVFVIVPNKEQVYSEKLPACFDHVGPTRLDPLASYAARGGDVPILR